MRAVTALPVGKITNTEAAPVVYDPIEILGHGYEPLAGQRGRSCEPAIREIRHRDEKEQREKPRR